MLKGATELGVFWRIWPLPIAFNRDHYRRLAVETRISQLLALLQVPTVSSYQPPPIVPLPYPYRTCSAPSECGSYGAIFPTVTLQAPILYLP